MGILGGYVGKVGTVVGFNWKGKEVMRAYKEAGGHPPHRAAGGCAPPLRGMFQDGDHLPSVQRAGLPQVRGWRADHGGERFHEAQHARHGSGKWIVGSG